MPSFRFSIRFCFALSAIVAISLVTVQRRRTNQQHAIRQIESNGGLVARFDEWIVLGNSSKIAHGLPSELCSTQTNWFFNEPIREVLVTPSHYDGAMRAAIQNLPTIERIKVLDDNTGKTTELVRCHFPTIEVMNIDQVLRKIFR